MTRMIKSLHGWLPVIALILASDEALCAEDFVCGPWLQMPTAHSMEVLWETRNPSGGSVEYGLSEHDLALKAEGPPGETIHHVVLGDLEPATEYWYRVSSDGVSSQTWSFRTAPSQGQDVETRVVFWSDLQHGWNVINADGTMDETWGNEAALMTRENLAQMTQFRPHLQFVLGDITDSGFHADEWRHAINALLPLMATAPMMAAPGNHDFGRPPSTLGVGGKLAQVKSEDEEPDPDPVVAEPYKYWKQYLSLPGNPPSADLAGLFYSFDYGNIHFIVPPRPRRSIDEWIARDVADARSRGQAWIIAGMHILWYGDEPHESWLKYDYDFLFCGHTHCYQRSLPILREDPVRFGLQGSMSSSAYGAKTEGILFVNTGTVGSYGPAGERNQNSLLAAVANDLSSRSYSRMTFRGQRAEFETLDSQGRVLDSFLLDRSDLKDEGVSPPRISSLRATPLSGHALSVAWETDGPSLGYLEYHAVASPDDIRRTPIFQDIHGPGSSTHRAPIFGLSPRTAYRVRVRARRGTEWTESRWVTIKTPKMKPGELVCILNYSAASEFFLAGTRPASLEPYAPDLGMGWMDPEPPSRTKEYPVADYAFGSRVDKATMAQNLEGLRGTDPVSPHGRYLMSLSSVRVPNTRAIPYRLDLPDGSYTLTVGLGNLWEKSPGKVRVGASDLERQPLPNLRRRLFEPDFATKYREHIRVQGGLLAGQDELSLPVEVIEGHLIFEVGAGDSSWPDATALSYLIVHTR